MSESLWNAADDYLATQILANMGSAGSYTTLKLTSVEKWARFDPIDFRNITTPFAVIVSYRNEVVPAGHSSESRSQTNDTFSISVLLVTEGTLSVATTNAKILAWRLQKFLRELRITGLTSDDGSKVDRLVRGDKSMFVTEIALWDKPSTINSDSVYGIAEVAFRLQGITV